MLDTKKTYEPIRCKIPNFAIHRKLFANSFSLSAEKLAGKEISIILLGNKTRYRKERQIKEREREKKRLK